MTVALSPHPCHGAPDAVAGSSLVDGARVRSLADRYGTPVYLYDAQVLERTWRSLRGALPRRMEIFYSIKANPNRELLRFFLDRDCGLEVASGGELQLALEAGCDPARLFFAGPGKTDAELELAVGKGVGEIHTESVNEIRRLGSIARRLDRMTPIALRVNPASDVQGGAVRMGGTAAAFGIDEERLDPAVDAALAEPHLRLDGVHLRSQAPRSSPPTSSWHSIDGASKLRGAWPYARDAPSELLISAAALGSRTFQRSVLSTSCSQAPRSSPPTSSWHSIDGASKLRGAWPYARDAPSELLISAAALGSRTFQRSVLSTSSPCRSDSKNSPPNVAPTPSWLRRDSSWSPDVSWWDPPVSMSRRLWTSRSPREKRSRSSMAA